MYDNYLRERITELRREKGVSEYKMSLALGHSKTYIQSISSGKSMPSMLEFFYICDYLGVTPMEFFDDKQSHPAIAHQIYELTKQMGKEDLEALLGIAMRLSNQHDSLQ